MTATLLALVVPLAAALVVAVVPRSEPGLVRGLGLLGSLAELAVILVLISGWDPEGATVQRAMLEPWLPGLGVAWSFGLEGTVLWPLLLVGVTFPLALMIGQGPRAGEPPLVIGMLVLESAWVVVLLARDLAVLGLAWQVAMLAIIVLLGERGDGSLGVPGRTSAARRYAAHALVGAATLNAAIVLLGVAHAHASGGVWTWDLDSIGQVVMPAGFQQLGFVLVAITLATTLPLFPFQGWLGPAGAAGPTPVLAVVLGVGMPMAVVVLQRVGLLFPLAAGEWADPIAAISVAGAVYAGLACWAERDPGRLLGHVALLHMVMLVLAAVSGTHGGRLGLGPLALAHGVGITLLVMVFGWLRRRKVGNLAELAGWASVAPRALTFAMVGVLVIAGVPGTVGFFGQLDATIAMLAAGDMASIELLHPRAWALLASLSLAVGCLGVLRSLWHAGRGRARPGLSDRLSDIDVREQIVGVALVILAIGLSLAVGPLAQHGGRAQLDALDSFHRARCLAIEARAQPRPLLQAELSAICLDPAARIRQVYGLSSGSGPSP